MSSSGSAKKSHAETDREVTTMTFLKQIVAHRRRRWLGRGGAAGSAGRAGRMLG